MEGEKNRLIVLKDAIQKGFESRRAEKFESVKYLKSLKAKKDQKANSIAFYVLARNEAISFAESIFAY